MRANELAAVEGRLEAYLEGLTGFMGRRDWRAGAGAYVRGLLLDGQRKSAEPMATRLGKSKQGLQQFVSQSPWPAARLLEGLVEREARQAGAGLLDHRRDELPEGRPAFRGGRARQCCGALGKIANCQVAVSLHRAGERTGESRPLSWRLYLSEAWTEDVARRSAAGTPAEVIYQSKTDLALAVIDEASRWGALPGVVLADEAYGGSFRVARRPAPAWLALLRAAAKAHKPTASPGSHSGRPTAGARVRSPNGWRKRGLSNARRVPRNPPATGWRRPAPTCCHCRRGWLRPRRAGASSRTTYRELKEELGLDHFEGRSWQGWCHHVVLVSAAFAFLRAEQRRRTPRAQKKPAATAPADPAPDPPAPPGRAHPLLRLRGGRFPAGPAPAQRRSFTCETVMSSPDKVALLEQAQRLGFRTYLYFIATDDPEINVSRVHNRVRMGGHPVPEDKIISRYARSLDLLIHAVRHTDRACIFDTSGEGKRQTWLAEITEGYTLER